MTDGPRYLLDTHAALWAQLDPVRLGQRACDLLTGLPPAAVAVSDVTLTETARLLRDGRLRPAAEPPLSELWLDRFALCYTVLPVTSRIAWAAAAFEWPHRDPCDRQILATAWVHALPLLSLDPEICAFAPSVGVRVIWA